MHKYKVIRYYTACAFYEVEAANEDEAYEKAKQGEGLGNTYYSEEDDDYEVTPIEELE